MENQLETLAKKYGTDKQMSGHGYTQHYYRHFKDIQNLELKILEIGVHKGFSLCMWADWFSNSQIYGIDDGSTGDLRSVYDNPRINFHLGKQSDPSFLESLVKEVGYFDIVIDDGSHFSTDIIPSLNYLYQHTKKFYVIEELVKTLRFILQREVRTLNSYPSGVTRNLLRSLRDFGCACAQLFRFSFKHPYLPAQTKNILEFK